jgi:hypothetical protein
MSCLDEATREQIVARHPVDVVAERYDVALERIGEPAGNYLVGCCPRLTGPRARLYIDRARQWWICLGQGVVGGDALDLAGCLEYGHAWDVRNPDRVRQALEILARDRSA